MNDDDFDELLEDSSKEILELIENKNFNIKSPWLIVQNKVHDEDEKINILPTQPIDITTDNDYINYELLHKYIKSHANSSYTFKKVDKSKQPQIDRSIKEKLMDEEITFKVKNIDEANSKKFIK